MNHGSIISADLLQRHLSNPAWRIVDCRFNLIAPDDGLAQYQIEHIPNAVYAHLKHDLSAPVSSSTGRHPLPDVEQFKRKLGAWGIDNSTQVVAYDDAAGSFAARLWWLLRWLGHKSVAVLDGGFTVWKQRSMPTTAQVPQFAPVAFAGKPDLSMLVDTGSLEQRLKVSDVYLVDVRDPRRYLGLEEPIDTIAGHIPGAKNIPWKTNIDNKGLFLPKAQLQTHYSNLLRESPVENLVFMCGSGVTACHSLLALDYLGLSGAKLYAGSWSEWITDPARAVERSKDQAD
ncbi:MAG TPA: sulfurtransferase [Gammaproteobacteria bacterium]